MSRRRRIDHPADPTPPPLGAPVETGRVRHFSVCLGYGWVIPDRGGRDLFLGAGSVRDARTTVHPGDPIEFVRVETARGERAIRPRRLDARP